MFVDGTPPRRADQATRLRRLVQTADVGGAARSIAVTSGKGGVGKSNIAVNLAACLAGRGLRVTLVDSDIGLANDDVLLGLRCTHNLSHVLSGHRGMEDIAVDAPGGFRFVPGLSGGQRSMDLSASQCRQLIGQMADLEAGSDVVLADCGAGLSRNVLAFAMAVDAVLLVTTPEPTAVADAYATIKRLWREQCRARIHLLVNLASSRAEARETFQRIAQVAEKFLKYPIADGGYLLQDTHVEMAVRTRCPFVLRYPRCPASACLGAVAVRMAKRTTRPVAEGGCFRRVVGLFVP